MESMANEVIQCIGQGKFSGKPLSCYRGIRDDEFVFDDEEKLREFLMLSESAKQDCDWTYEPKDIPLHRELVMTWNVNSSKRSYIDDYNIMARLNSPTTNWSDKYSCMIYREESTSRGDEIRRYQLQPIPDFVRWFETEELHYLSSKKAIEVADAIPHLRQKSEIYLPSRLFNTLLRITDEIPEDVLHSMAIMSCLTLDELKENVNEKKQKQMNILSSNLELEKYRGHNLYKKKKVELIEQCKKDGIKFKSKKKHEIVKLLLQTNEELPPYKPMTLDKIPETLNKIMGLPVTDLQHILHENGLSFIGVKDELALRVFLKKAHKEDFISKTEVDYLLNVIKISKEVILQEKRLNLLGYEDHGFKRKFSSKSSSSTLRRPQDISLENMFNPLETFLKSFTDPSQRSETIPVNEPNEEDTHDDTYERFFQVGTKVKIFWNREGVKDMGWRGGWYVAHVTDICTEEDQISVQYVSEPDSVYSVEVMSFLSEGSLKLA